MSRRLRPRARVDVQQIITYHESASSADLALAFLEAVEAAIGFVAQHPDTGSPRWQHLSGIPGLRTWPIKGFPHLLFYVEKTGKVQILRVLHAARDIPITLRD